MRKKQEDLIRRREEAKREHEKRVKEQKNEMESWGQSVYSESQAHIQNCNSILEELKYRDILEIIHKIDTKKNSIQTNLNQAQQKHSSCYPENNYIPLRIISECKEALAKIENIKSKIKHKARDQALADLKLALKRIPKFEAKMQDFSSKHLGSLTAPDKDTKVMDDMKKMKNDSDFLHGFLSNLKIQPAFFPEDIPEIDAAINNLNPKIKHLESLEASINATQTSTQNSALFSELDANKDNHDSMFDQASQAIEDDNFDALKYIIEVLRFPVNYVKHNTGNTLLHSAAEFNKIFAVKYLLSKSFFNIRNKEKKTPLDIAKEMNYTEIINILK